MLHFSGFVPLCLLVAFWRRSLHASPSLPLVVVVQAVSSNRQGMGEGKDADVKRPSRAQMLCAYIYLDETSSRLRHLKAALGDPHGLWVGVKVGSLTTAMREFQALHCLKYSRFVGLLLKPPRPESLYPGQPLARVRAKRPGLSDVTSEAAESVSEKLAVTTILEATRTCCHSVCGGGM